MQPLLTGLLTGFSLIVAIGAQNAFVLRQGLAKKHIFAVVLICAVSDALLIALGILGLGGLIQALPWLLEIIRWFGVLYLTWFGISSLRRAFRTEALVVTKENTTNLKATIVGTLAITYLNPHVYLDTVVFVGGIANQFGDQRWLFAIGAMSASFIWFFSLGFTASKAAALMSKPKFWKILDTLIALVMFSIALTLVFAKLD